MKYTIQQGLIIPLETKYIKFTKSSSCSIISDELKTEVRFTEGISSTEFSLKFNQVNPACDVLLHETDWYKINNAKYKIGCISFRKCVDTDYVFSQFLCSDVEDFIVDYDETHCAIIVPESKMTLDSIDKVHDYLRCFSINPYLKVDSIECHPGYKLANFYQINLAEKNLVKESESYFLNNTTGVYDKFRLRTIDVQDSFLAQFEHLINKRGIVLVDTNKDKHIPNTNQISYKITGEDRQLNNKSAANVFRPGLGLQIYEMTIDFYASFADYILYENFRRDYGNYTFISNWDEFNTKDKYKEKWLSNIWWEPIPTDFNHDFQQDEDGNYAYPLNFSCKIRYFVVEDPDVTKLGLINQVVAKLTALDQNNDAIESDTLVDMTVDLSKMVTKVDGSTRLKDELIIQNPSGEGVGDVTYRIILAYCQNGKVTGMGQYAEGSECTLTCVPDPGWEMDFWVGTDCKDPVITFTVNDDIIMVPILKPIEDARNGS